MHNDGTPASSFKALRSRSASLARSLSGVLPFKSAAAEEDINQEISDMRRTIRNYRRMIIHPRSSKWIHYWDAGAFACLLFTACVTPVEVCVLAPEPLVLLLASVVAGLAEAVRLRLMSRVIGDAGGADAGTIVAAGLNALQEQDEQDARDDAEARGGTRLPPCSL